MRTDSSYVDFTYDDIGQLKTAKGKENGGTTNRMNEQFGYAYDAAWNLATRTNNALIQSFTNNGLNQLTSAGRSGTLTVAGTVTSTATNVTVNGTNALLYADATFAGTNHPITNVYTAIARDAFGRISTNSVTVSLPENVNLTYDKNGNLTNDGNRVFTYYGDSRIGYRIMHQTIENIVLFS